jgi:predicted ester cyclase
MNNTSRIAAGITTLIGGSALVLAPFTASAQSQPTVETGAVSCVHVSVWACPSAAVGSNERSPSVMSIDETQAVIDAYVAALVAREDIAPYFSDDVVLELVDVGQRVEGRDEVVAAIVELHEQTFDARPELKKMVIGEGTAALELVFVGTHTGEFAGIPASGTEVAVPYAVFYDVADAKITALRIHGFATGLVAALTAGATPAPATTAP